MVPRNVPGVGRCPRGDADCAPPAEAVAPAAPDMPAPTPPPSPAAAEAEIAAAEAAAHEHSDEESGMRLAAAQTAGLTATGPARFAAYNGPLTPWFMRRNEVLLPVAAPR